MAKKDFSRVKTLLCVENQIVRQGVQNALQNDGFPRGIEVAAFDKVLEALMDGNFDLIITQTELGEEFLPPFMGQLRRGDLGHHPVPIILQILMAAEGDYVRKVIDSGPDDILQLPLSPMQLMQRLHILADKRKSFVVTSDYVGPDRRQGVRPGAIVVPTLDVPNPLAAKVSNKPDEELARDIEDAAERLKQMRLARHTFELQWLLHAIRQLFEQGSQDSEKLFSFCERIKTLLFGLPRLLPIQYMVPIGPVRDKLEKGANIIMKNGFDLDIAVLQGLGGVVAKLAMALREALPPELAETTTPNAPTVPHPPAD